MRLEFSSNCINELFGVQIMAPVGVVSVHNQGQILGEQPSFNDFNH